MTLPLRASPAMLQAPTPDTTTWTKIGIGAAGTILGWLLKSMLMTGFKKAVIDSVSADLDERFRALEAHNEERFNKINERIDVLAERRQWPRR